MREFTKALPLSIYIHLPWCIRKCPYCDFNSHTAPRILPEEDYLAMLLQEFDAYLPHIADRTVHSIFFGGGTPSLFSAETIGTDWYRLSIPCIAERSKATAEMSAIAPAALPTAVLAAPGGGQCRLRFRLSLTTT